MAAYSQTMSSKQIASCQIDAPIAARPRLLRAVLWANAAFSILSGMLFLVAAKEISALAGITSKEDIRIIGGSVLVFAVVVMRTASRKVIRPRAVWPLVEGDLAWIVATAILMAFRVFSPAGNWLFGECACIVLLLALGEFLGLRRLRTGTAPLILVVVAIGAVFWTEANAFADLRPTSWKHNGPSTQDVGKGREILAKAAERHGAAALRALRVMDYVAPGLSPGTVTRLLASYVSIWLGESATQRTHFPKIVTKPARGI